MGFVEVRGFFAWADAAADTRIEFRAVPVPDFVFAVDEEEEPPVRKFAATFLVEEPAFVVDFVRANWAPHVVGGEELTVRDPGPDGRDFHEVEVDAHVQTGSGRKVPTSSDLAESTARMSSCTMSA